MEPEPLLDAFFDRVKSDLQEKRQRRLLEVANARNLLTPAQSEALREAAASGQPLSERSLVDRGWITPEQLAELRRTVDADSGSTSSSPLLVRYELHEKLGEGAMSQVFRGMDRQLHRPVAVKILRENLLFQETARKRFGREAQSLARMDHPNVVRVYDSGETGTQMYLVMEFVEGESLGSILGRKGKDLRGLLGLLEQAARGIHHAHQKGIIHRDIKPQNILVTKAGELKVADFGLAHLLDSDPGLTGTGAVLGTPLYMAPEQVGGGAGQITHRTDVYALGAILYEVLTGWPPHRGSAISEVYDKILHENPLPPHLAADGVPAELEVIALKAVEKDPSHRFASAEDFADDLRRYLAGEPILARPVSAVTRWARWARKRQAIVWPVLAAGVLVALGAASWITRQHRQTEASRLLVSARYPLDRAARAQYSRGSTSIQDFSRWVGEAQGSVEKAVQLAPELPSAHHLRGEVQILRGHYEEAERSWREAIKLDPKLGSAHFRLGQVLLWQAFLYREDMWSDPKGLRQEASTKQALEGAEELRIAQAEGSGFDSELQREIAVAMLAYLQGKPESVRETCKRAIERFGEAEGTEEFHWLLGLIPAAPAEQIRALDLAIEIKPMFPLALYARGRIRGALTPERLQKSIDDFSQAILIHPDFAEAYIFRGSLALGKPDLATAIADFNRAVTLGRRQAAAYNGRASVRLNHLNDLDGAIADLDEAIRRQPEDYAMPYNSRAIAYYRKKNYDAALRDAAKELEIGWRPGFIAMHRLRAKCFDAKGDLQGTLAEATELAGTGATRQTIDRLIQELHQERLRDEQQSHR
jgi:tetratricopeptide (TPR) repeat protein/tRNA A-37 threonylcarbamoyl transferase component Bud32